MSKLKVSEIFYSAQGEGRFVGVPSVFLRTFGCNFKCAGFGMPRGTDSTEADAVAKTVELYKSYDDLPLVNTGCDSYAAWHPKFKHLSPTYDTSEVVERMLALTPNNRWQQANGNDVHLVITGGEPLLGWQRAYGDLFDHERMKDLKNITFETNGTQELTDEFGDVLDVWQFGKDSLGHRELTFSVSAKLSASGESWSDAIKPEIVTSYQEFGTTYLKFVVEKPQDFDEVDRAVVAYRDAGFTGVVYIMPVGGVVSVYDGNKFNVADEAMLRGYYYSPRLHVDLWGNSWGK
jgi:7-carboxy-7-deazaguanine synthase